jgi:hypothetical protein
MRSAVIGATGIVGGYIVDNLVRSGERPIALSRSKRDNTADVEWFEGDLSAPEMLKLPSFTTLYCTAHAGLMAAASVLRLANPRRCFHINQHCHEGRIRDRCGARERPAMGFFDPTPAMQDFGWSPRGFRPKFK